ncbi:unnamed protein product [Medioppia subpectinata]|uniref:Uncharacterized protein n=1 Tax=Medioppia subpectinata TaxID=1979941 RepID=A0A7R9KGX9_9ACAR|nr:unnamed protein product [Medioppia subpectinata]CAG2103164.1 unnamed protein product [Medioppia subpectinata]
MLSLNAIIGFQLIIPAIVVNGEYCPSDPDVISPCSCDGKRIKCVATEPIDLAPIMELLLNGAENRSYETFELMSTAVTKLDAYMFKGVQFNQIILTGCSQLACVHPMAFGGQEASVTRFEATLTNLSSLRGKDCDLFGALSSLTCLESIAIIGSEWTKIPDQAFNNKLGDQVNLTTITFSNGGSGGKLQRIGKEAFSALKALKQLDVSYHNLTRVDDSAFNLSDYIGDGMTINLMGNALTGTSFGGDIVTDGAVTQLKLGANRVLKYLPQNVFKGVFKANKKNTIDLSGDLMEIDLNNKWLVEQKVSLDLNHRLLHAIGADGRPLLSHTIEEMNKPPKY